MKILVVNAGSSSLKYQLINMEDESVIAKGNCDCIGLKGLDRTNVSHKKAVNGSFVGFDSTCEFPSHTEAFQKLVELLTTGETAVVSSMSEISAVGHRIVQGAEVFDRPCLITPEIIDKIDELKELAPVHNHAHALALRACTKVLPEGTPQVAVFDTAFHQTMPKKAYMYGLPYEDYTNYSVRKYGFHGTSHRFVSAALAEAMGKKPEELKIISCHLGNGSSISAVDGGKCVDTSMGFTPLDGLLMGTRCGALDPSVVTYLSEKHGFTPKEMSDYMNKKSGFLGVSGVGSDNRDLCAAAEKGDERAILTCEMFAYQIQKYIGSYTAAMNGVDAILFTGGIGENSSEVRERVCTNMEFFGIKLDVEKNKTSRGKIDKISTADSKTEVWVIPTNEELLIARDTLAVVSK